MESAMVNAEAEENTAGSAGENKTPATPADIGEKLLPPGHPLEVKSAGGQGVPLSASAKDALFGGNVVAAGAKKEALEAWPEEKTEQEPEDDDTARERNLREIGLREALPHAGKEPPRTAVPLAPFFEKGGLPRVRTYAADMSEEIKKRGVTLSSIVTAEQSGPRPGAVVAQPRSGRRWFVLAGALAFVVLGIGMITAAFVFFGKGDEGALPLSESIIPVNYRVRAAAEEKTPLTDVLARVRAESAMNLGEITEVIITREGVPLSPTEILTALNAPNELARNAETALIGIHAGNGNQPFMLIGIPVYDRAFQAMLSWEETMAESLQAFFAPEGGGRAAARPPPLHFTDRVTVNLDIRESQKEWPILYVFPEQHLLLITTNESTLREILTRLSFQRGSSS